MGCKNFDPFDGRAFFSPRFYGRARARAWLKGVGYEGQLSLSNNNKPGGYITKLVLIYDMN